MKNRVKIITTALAVLTLVPAYAQHGQPPGGMPHGGMTMGGGPHGPEFTGAIGKLLGKNSSFSATLELQTTAPSGNQSMTMPGKVYVDDGKSRFEMDMSQMKGIRIPPEHMEQIKSMGMNKVVTISLPGKKVTDVLYPGLQAYYQTGMPAAEAAKPESQFKLETTKLGTDTIDSHSCVKDKVIVTGPEEKKHTYTVWRAKDLKDFPIKIETTSDGRTMTMLFKEVKLSKPEASLFEPPSDYKQYDSFMSMMMEKAMKQMHGGAGMPPGGH